MSNKLDIPGCTASNRMVCGGTLFEDAVADGRGVTRARVVRTFAEADLGRRLLDAPHHSLALGLDLESPRYMKGPLHNPVCSSRVR
jgi:hypothetical protein